MLKRVLHSEFPDHLKIKDVRSRLRFFDAEDARLAQLRELERAPLPPKGTIEYKEHKDKLFNLFHEVIEPKCLSEDVDRGAGSSAGPRPTREGFQFVERAAFRRVVE